VQKSRYRRETPIASCVAFRSLPHA
jgi:hypothetical protein